MKTTTRTTQTTSLFATLIGLISLLSSVQPSSAVDFIVELTAEGTELGPPHGTEVPDGFPRLQVPGVGGTGIPIFKPSILCSAADREICLPTECTLDTSRTHSTPDSRASRGFGQAGAGYGIFLHELNDPSGIGIAIHHMDYTRNCLTSNVRVCRKNNQRAVYRATHVLFAQCRAETEWTNSIVKPAPPTAFSLSPADGYRQLAEYDGPVGTLTGIQAQVTRYGVRVLSKSPPTADLQVGMFAQSPLVSPDNGRFFWAQNTANNDLSITAVEVTQGIQNFDNEMPLVARRRTTVRAHVRSLLNVGSVQARIRGFRDGTELPLSPLTPEDPINIATTGGQRTRLLHSFLFTLPPDWRQEGDLRLRLSIDTANTVPEIDETNNTRELTVQFHPAQGLELTTVPFHLHAEGDRNEPVLTYYYTDATFWPIATNLVRQFPISALLLHDCGLAPQNPTFHNRPFRREWNLTEDRDRSRILSRVMWLRGLSFCARRTHWVGLVHPAIPTTSDTGGMVNGSAYTPGWSSWVRMNADSPQASPWFVAGGATLAHELGHNRGLSHVLCTGDEPDSDPDYPHPLPDCRLAEGNDGFFGLDVYHGVWGLPEPTVISNDPNAPLPHRALPLMSYERLRWISPYSYCALLLDSGIPCNPLDARSSRSAPGFARSTSPLPSTDQGPLAAEKASHSAAVLKPRRPSAFLLVGGILDDLTGQVEDLTVRRLPSLPPNLSDALVRRPGDDRGWSLVQVNGSGAPLKVHPLYPSAEDETGGFLPFLEAVPAEQGVAGVVIMNLGVSVASRFASPHAPTVRLLEPNHGTLLGPTTVRWTANDPDGDPLTVSLYYSPDDGLTWRLLALDLVGSSYRIEGLRVLPGSTRGRFRVEAHDGFNTATDDSDGRLSVPDSRPYVAIIEADGLQFPLGRTVQLTGLATDVEDGPLTADKRFVWRSDRDGLVGRGREFYTRRLSRGIHRIRLTTTDSAGNVGADERIVFIGIERPVGTWTAWLDRDNPSGFGDYETLSDFVRSGHVCEHPLGVECRTVGDELDSTRTGQAYRCDPRVGGICENRLQGEGDQCLDYEVRFLCLPGHGT